MARPQERLPENVPGPFYVDRSCIDCGTCWQFDPLHFAPTGLTSHVVRQPSGLAESRQALMALQACPVAAIGTTVELRNQTPTDGFPALITRHADGDVYYCGWASRRSFGASSWLVVRPEGNVLIDSPRWSAPLARRISALGGLQAMVLTHRDDVADQERWAKAFGCRRWIHQADADAAPGAECLVQGTRPVVLDQAMQLIPCPGHTPGSMVLVLGSTRPVLFSGDHLWWNPTNAVLVASERYCWWDFQEQLHSVERLQDLDVAWLLPGHGHAHRFESGAWRMAIDQTLAFNRKSPCC